MRAADSPHAASDDSVSYPRLFCSHADPYLKIITILCHMLRIHVTNASTICPPIGEGTAAAPDETTSEQSLSSNRTVRQWFALNIIDSRESPNAQRLTAYLEDYFDGKPITLRGGDTIIKFIAGKYGNHSSLYPAAFYDRCMIDNKLWFNSNKLLYRMQNYSICQVPFSFHLNFAQFRCEFCFIITQNYISNVDCGFSPS